MYTVGMQEHTQLEEEYFYKKDRELIEKLKESEKQKFDLLARTAHYHKCSSCGLRMVERTIENFSLLHCDNCESIHLNLKNLDIMAQQNLLKHVLSELLDKMKQHKESA